MAGDDKAPMRVASKISSTKFQEFTRIDFPKKIFSTANERFILA
jgi:hypothetical protein